MKSYLDLGKGKKLTNKEKRIDILYNLEDDAQIKQYDSLVGRVEDTKENKTELLFSDGLNNLLGDSVDKASITKLSYCITLLWQQGCLDTYKQLNADICNYWSQIPWEALRIWQWRTLYRIAMTNGMFELALILRKKYKTSIRETTDKRYLWRKLQCAFEDDELDITKKIITTIKNNSEYINYCAVDIEKAELLLNILDNEKIALKDSAFYNYIDGKIIQIIGPTENNKIINKKNYIKVKINENKIQEESASEIAYYNHEVYNEIKDKQKKLLNIFKYVVINRFMGNDPANAREIIRFNSLFLIGSPQILLRILFDLNVGNPSGIYVTGMNLYTSTKVYNSSYIGANKRSNWQQAVSIGIHDIISQFFFLQNMYKHRCFKADNILTELMNLDVKEYILRVESALIFQAMKNNLE